MENNRLITRWLILILGGTLLVLPFFVLAYDDKTTHPALTQEIIKFYNSSFLQNKINSEDGELVIRGSIDEDANPRWLRHFYDPVYKRGLTLIGNEFDQYTGLAAVIAGAHFEFESSKLWAEDTLGQAGLFKSITAGILTSYFDGEDDYSWERGIYEYTWGDRKRGLKTLGHILHLLEDASVPDHVRNDPHPPVLEMGSPYEFWTERFTRNTLSIQPTEKPIVLNSLPDYFEHLATYANNNFFSKDTIQSNEYSNPTILQEKEEILSNGISYKFGYRRNENGGPYRVARIERKIGGQDLSLTIEDTDDLILSDYWSLLSKQAVLHGAGVIKLFFDEVEREKQTKTLYNKNRSWLERQIDNFRQGVFGVASTLYGITVTEKDLSGDSQTQTSPTHTTTFTETQNNTLPAPAPSPEPASVAPKISPAETQTVAINPPSSKSSNTSKDLPIAGVGGAPSVDTTENSSATELNVENSSSPPPTPSPASPPADIIPPDAPIISEPAEDNLLFTRATITFVGSAEKGSLITNSYNNGTTTVDGSNAWSLPIEHLTEGRTAIEFFATDPAGNISSTSAKRVILIDSKAPDIAFNIKECANSFSYAACLTKEKTLHLEWSSSSPDINYFSLECTTENKRCANWTIGTTTGTSTIYVFQEDNANISLTLTAFDFAGNSRTQTQRVEIAARPVVINEIAWAGTSAARAEDEFIELFNPTAEEINLSGWVLRSKTDNTPYIKLSGTIPAHGFFLLERTDDTTISDIGAGQIYTGALNNGGEVLELSYASTTIDQTPDTALCRGWCGGSDSLYLALERFDPFTEGSTPDNWGSTFTTLANGKNADGAAIKGTPGKRNSINYFPSRNNLLNQNKILTKSESPYLISSVPFSVTNGITLTIEPGVVIKFLDSAALSVNGTLIAEGTAEEPIIFTSFKDDSYGGDTNNDGASTSPKSGTWQYIKLLGNNSRIDHAILRYGGSAVSNGMDHAILEAENTNFSLKNSIVEEAGVYGLFLTNASGTIEENEIRKNQGKAPATGLYASGGNLTIRNNLFSDNTQGLFLTDTIPGNTIEITQNTFTGNIGEAIHLTSAFPLLPENNAIGNGTNGIVMQGALNQDYTLSSNLPFVFQNNSLTIPARKTLTITPGTILKLKSAGSLSVSGTLLAEGEEDKKIIFTSLNDDEYGGDTNGTTTIPKSGDWGNILFTLGSETSRIKNAIIRYGGMQALPSLTSGAIHIQNTSLNLEFGE